MYRQTNKQFWHKNCLKSRQGFTLAEVLLVITIIGIISSYTIPGMLNSINNQQLRTAWKSKYSEISSATQMIILDRENMKGLISADHEVLRNVYKGKMNIVKDCGWSNFKGVCWHNDYEWYASDGVTPLTNGAISIGKTSVMSDGSFITFNSVSNDCSYTAGDPAWSWLGIHSACGWIYVDTNGFKKPNTRGKDIMEIIITQNGIHAYGDYGGNRSPRYEALFLIQ